FACQRSRSPSALSGMDIVRLALDFSAQSQVILPCIDLFNMVRYRKNTRIIYSDNERIPGDSFLLKDEKKITLQVRKDTSHHDLLLSGVKIVMDEIKGLPGAEENVEQDIFAHTDTALFKKLFDKKLHQNNLFFKISWGAADKDHSGKCLYFDSRLFEKPYGAAIYQYNSYLIKKIFPEIAFAFILILLTGFAFGISFHSMKKQSRLNILKDNFINNVSHELKTPVSTIKVAIEALQNFNALENPKITAEYLEMARLETERLEQLIDHILNTSVLESGKEIMHFEKTDLNELIQDTLTSLKWKFEKQSAQIKFHQAKYPVILNIDKLHIQGVLINLIDNSLKYNSGIPEISISTFSSNNFFKITIEDNGPGIPEEYIDKVFDRFFRVPHGDTHNVKGYGLGLTYAAQVMQQHKGTIEVKNREPKGCIFTLSFPISA
ncbi:MAG: sensor histidine kinase, partial [Bacteroidia bacterium]